MDEICVGDIKGKWKVLEVFIENWRKYCRCECICGKIKRVDYYNIRKGSSLGCGCNRKNRQTHGKSNSPEYRIYRAMINRCNLPSQNSYENYGGRGIKVCDRWMDSFENFYDDMGERPTKDHSIERLDVNGDYGPLNCVWVTIEKQCRNRRKRKDKGDLPMGVSLRVRRGREDSYMVCWKGLQGEDYRKYFSILKYGKEEAFRLACEAREEAIKRLNEQGAGYSENHGK